MWVALFMIFSSIDSYQKDKRIRELELKELEREWAKKYGLNYNKDV